MDNSQNEIKKNSDARIRANNKYNKSHYKNISIRLAPNKINYIKQVAINKDLSIAQLIYQAVRAFDNTQEQDINVEPDQE